MSRKIEYKIVQTKETRLILDVDEVPTDEQIKELVDIIDDGELGFVSHEVKGDIVLFEPTSQDFSCEVVDSK